MKQLLFILGFYSLTFNIAAQDTSTLKNDTLPVHYVTSTVFHYTNNLHELEGMSTVKLETATDVRPEVKEAFYATFKNATNVKWFVYGKKKTDYIVAFNYNERDYKALLNKEGKIIYTLFDGLKSDLPTTIQKLIHVWYPNYLVAGLVKVKSRDKDGFIVNLRNRDELMVLSVENERIEELGLFTMIKEKE